MNVIPANFASGYGLVREAGDRALLLAVVGADLRRLYGDVAAAPLPDAMAALVARLPAGPGGSRR